MKNILLIAGLALSTITYAQLPPVVTGDTMLCPEGTGTLTTGTYDNYQWFQRYYMTDDTFAIQGATSQTLNMNYYDFAGSYISVKVLQNGESSMSEEILVDGYAFTSPVISMTGDFETGPNGEAIICYGDSLVLQLLEPYTENVSWYNGNQPVAGSQDSVLVVYVGGSYTATGSPEVCPDYSASSGVPIEVMVQDCGLGIDENSRFVTEIYPNPAEGKITVKTSEMPVKLTITDGSGRKVAEIIASGMITEISLAGITAGTYLLEATYETGKNVQRFVVK